MKNVLITGAASGIGKAVKDYFINNGYTVIALDKVKMDKENNLLSYVVDITDKEQLNMIKESLKEMELSTIINVAGIHKMASLVENDFDSLKKLIDINLLGTMLVNNIFYPLLSKNGRIIIVTSEVAKLEPMPFNGLYNISKSALDTYAQALRQELNLLGQKVITIRPGAIETPLSIGSLDDTEKLAQDTVLFKKQAHKFLDITKKFMGKPIKPKKVAKLIYKATVKKNPKFIYKIHHNILLVFLSILPIRLQCFVIKLILK
ncbi:MAG: SDR family NAD(P)-dependent oxidoreductase [Bacilli bacterium]|nr:SDR family NAD(P)-dependent oxidoreductase [Bacilli bacterium]